MGDPTEADRTAVIRVKLVNAETGEDLPITGLIAIAEERLQALRKVSFGAREIIRLYAAQSTGAAQVQFPAAIKALSEALSYADAWEGKA